MALYLVQHGKSLSKEQEPRQGLSEAGVTEVKRIAGVAAGYGVCPRVIRHSVKERARQTAELFASALGPPEGMAETVGIKPMDDVTSFAGGLDRSDNQMVVGHLPFMERLVSYLVTGSVAPRVFKFQNGGIVCLDQDPGEPYWYIRWALMPCID
jgi:phosphohistidine phosphatase